MIKNFKLLIRLSCLLLILFISTGLALFLYPILPHKHWVKIARSGITCIRKACGIQLEIIGKPTADYLLNNTLVVANHISWLDSVILYSVYFINFVGKVEMRKWPLLNAIINSGGTIFINRQNKRQILQINRIICRKLQAGRCIGLFPEGGVGDGRQLKPFKAPLLEAAIQANSTIIPMILAYYHPNGSFAYEVSYSGLNLCQNIIATLRLDGFIAKIIVLPPVSASNFATRHQLSNYLHTEMEQVYRQRETKLTVAD